jgi:hypothetical protein
VSRWWTWEEARTHRRWAEGAAMPGEKVVDLALATIEQREGTGSTSAR